MKSPTKIVSVFRPQFSHLSGDEGCGGDSFKPSQATNPLIDTIIPLPPEGPAQPVVTAVFGHR